MNKKLINNELFNRAQKVMPGGVNSPVRSFKAVGGEPLFIKKANGSKIYDVAGGEYIDYVCSWGPMILGHNNQKIATSVNKAIENGLSFGAPTEAEVIMAELIIGMVPGIEMVRMVNSGTEAVMSAIRLARAYTKRNKIIKFNGCYHGHSDYMLVKAGSGALTLSQPDSLGISPEFANNTLIAEYNDLESVVTLFAQNKDEIAGVIIEPVAANMGVVCPQKCFLNDLQKLCHKNDTLLIFDEVITGFRLESGGAQAYFGVLADIVIFGKIIGGGLPVGAYAARKEIMELVAPLGGMYQAGTLSGNPIAMAAGISQLATLKENPEVYKQIENMAIRLADGFKEIIRELELPIWVNQIASMVSLFFTKIPVNDFKSAKTSDLNLFAKFFKLMLTRGIYLPPAQFEALFISAAHSEDDIKVSLKAAKESLKIMKESGDFN